MKLDNRGAVALRAWRQKHRVTRDKLNEALGLHVGRSRNYTLNYADGHSRPPLAVRIAIEERTGIHRTWWDQDPTETIEPGANLEELVAAAEAQAAARANDPVAATQAEHARARLSVQHARTALLAAERVRDAARARAEAAARAAAKKKKPAKPAVETVEMVSPVQHIEPPCCPMCGTEPKKPAKVVSLVVPAKRAR